MVFPGAIPLNNKKGWRPENTIPLKLFYVADQYFVLKIIS